MIDTVVPAVFPRLNPLFIRLMKSRFHALVGWYVVLIRFQGRRSGRSYEVPVSYHRHGNLIEAMTNRKGLWWKNLRDVPEVRVLFKGVERRARLTVVEDGAELVMALRSRDVVRRILMPVSPSQAVLLVMELGETSPDAGASTSPSTER